MVIGSMGYVPGQPLQKFEKFGHSAMAKKLRNAKKLSLRTGSHSTRAIFIRHGIPYSCIATQLVNIIQMLGQSTWNARHKKLGAKAKNTERDAKLTTHGLFAHTHTHTHVCARSYTIPRPHIPLVNQPDHARTYYRIQDAVRCGKLIKRYLRDRKLEVVALLVSNLERSQMTGVLAVRELVIKLSVGYRRRSDGAVGLPGYGLLGTNALMHATTHAQALEIEPALTFPTYVASGLQEVECIYLFPFAFSFLFCCRSLSRTRIHAIAKDLSSPHSANNFPLNRPYTQE